ncbi:hypothetical protein TRIUR3_32105 [Triticum urartu]|uniref:Uncharacterized protein n=1 Tax=Triticum urartu TaxID=4572 RepID=M8AM81_TRIUA|nr:hypothetical protein TRIUR3_32105 [Triticum urartu]
MERWTALPRATNLEKHRWSEGGESSGGYWIKAEGGIGETREERRGGGFCPETGLYIRTIPGGWSPGAVGLTSEQRSS